MSTALASRPEIRIATEPDVSVVAGARKDYKIAHPTKG